MRILHTSDWHLGRSLEGRSRLEEQVRFIDEICGIVEEEKTDLILIAGDINRYNFISQIICNYFCLFYPKSYSSNIRLD
jgi:predicted MPP superfamily phosphohydrolase